MDRTPEQWRALAEGAARNAHKNSFHGRRGFWGCGGADTLCLYDSSPRAGRDRDLAALRQRLAAAGIAELGCGAYPPHGAEGAGHTFALIVAARRDRERQIAAWWYDILAPAGRTRENA
jgi:hypothetical protein